MSDAITIKVHGLEEINRALGELPGKIANKVLRKGVSAGAMLLRGSIRAAAPVRKTGGSKLISWSRKRGAIGSTTRDPGYLKKNVGALYRRKVSSVGDIHYLVGPKGDAYYGYILEVGHVIGKRKRYGLGIAEHNAGMKRVPAYPFMVPVFNSMTSQIIDRMKEKLTEGIVKEGRDLGFQMK